MPRLILWATLSACSRERPGRRLTMMPHCSTNEVGETGHPGIERVTVKVYVTAGATEDEVERVWSDALALSPLARTLRDAVDLHIQLRIEP